MNIDIRKYIFNNFKNVSSSELRNTLDSSINEKDELTLPGMGVLMEIIWEKSDNELKKHLIAILKDTLN